MLPVVIRIQLTAVSVNNAVDNDNDDNDDNDNNNNDDNDDNDNDNDYDDRDNGCVMMMNISVTRLPPPTANNTIRHDDVEKIHSSRS